MKLSASGAMKRREDSQKLGGFGRMWKVGDQGIVYYPIFEDEETHQRELLVGMVWGHRVEMNDLNVKFSFIPTENAINDRGEPIGTPDLAYQFSRIAKLFIDGEKEKRKAEVLEKDWSGQPASAQVKALEDIEKDYDIKNNLKAKRAVIGRLELYITTECLYVPVENDVPQPQKAKIVTQTLSNDRITKLLALARNPMFMCDMEKGESWLEVGYTFTSANNNKAEAGRCDPQGISHEMSMAVRYPKEFATVALRLKSLPKDSTTIENRNYNYRKISSAVLRAALSTYCVMKSDCLSYLTSEGEEILIKNADIINDMRIKIQKDELREQVKAALIEKHSAPASPAAPAPTVPPDPTEDLPFGMVPSIEDIMNHAARAAETDTLNLDGTDGMNSVEL